MGIRNIPIGATPTCFSRQEPIRLSADVSISNSFSKPVQFMAVAKEDDLKNRLFISPIDFFKIYFRYSERESGRLLSFQKSVMFHP